MHFVVILGLGPGIQPETQTTSFSFLDSRLRGNDE